MVVFYHCVENKRFMKLKSYNRYLKIARQMYLISNCDSRKSFHVAFALYKGRIVFISTNSYKTHTGTAFYKGSDDRYLANVHAEFRLIRAVKYTTNIKLSEIDVLVVRIDGQLNAVMSKPCANCAFLLGKHRVKNVYFSGATGELCKL